MSPEAEIRLRIYQEGQRAYLSGSPCPYDGWDWRAKTWDKGYAAGEAYCSQTDSEPAHEVEPTLQMLKEEIAELRSEVEYLNKYLSNEINDLRDDMYSLNDERREE
jgi:hypothetical protein